MTQRYRKFKRAWGMWYAFDNATGNSVSLKTRVKAEAEQKVNAMNETERQPGISLGLARVYLNATDPKLATRTWQDVMQDIVAKKKDETRHRLETAIKDKNFDCIRALPVCETRPEHFDKALADGKVSSNVYLRRIHNHALGMGHNSKAVHRAYAKHAEVTVPSLADWEKDWQENPQRTAPPKLLPVVFRSMVATAAQSN